MCLMSDVRSARRHLGLSQAELALKLGVHQTTISRFETGDLPLDERTKLALDALTMRAAPATPERTAA
jgi:predicted transcriptional regulator